MPDESVNLLGLMRQKMAYHEDRQQVLAANIANVDTPGYKAKDIIKPEFGTSFHDELKLALTDPQHLTTGNFTRFRVVDDAQAFETNPNGNSVVVEEQMLKIADNEASFQQTTALYRKMLELSRIAVQGNSQ